MNEDKRKELLQRIKAKAAPKTRVEPPSDGENPFDKKRREEEARRKALLQRAKGLAKVNKSEVPTGGMASKNPFDPFDRKGKKIKDPDAPKTKEEAELRHVRGKLFGDGEFVKIALPYATKSPKMALTALKKAGWSPSKIKDPATGQPMDDKGFLKYWSQILMKGGLAENVLRAAFQNKIMEVLGAKDPSSGVYNKQRWAKKFVEDFNNFFSDLESLKKDVPKGDPEKVPDYPRDLLMVNKIFDMMAKVDPETIAQTMVAGGTWARDDEGFDDTGALGESKMMFKQLIKNRLMEAMGHKPKSIQERLKDIARKAIAEVYSVEEAPTRGRYMPSSKRPGRGAGYDPAEADREARAAARRRGFMTSPTGGASGEAGFEPDSPAMPKATRPGDPRGPRRRGEMAKGRLSSDDVKASYAAAQSEYEDELASDIGGTKEPVDSLIHDPEVQDWLRKAGLGEPTKGKRVGQPTTSKDVEDFFRG